VALTLLIVLVFSATVLLARGRWIAAIVLATMALPVLVATVMPMRRDSGQ
jgi:hypothetical protein